MGHPSDWDLVRESITRALPQVKTSAVSIKPAKDWDSGIRNIAESIQSGSILVGYSMGARLALSIAIQFPNLLKGLVFISGNPGLESSEEKKTRSINDQQIAKQLDSQPLEIFLKKWYQQPIFDSMDETIRSSEVDRKLCQNQPKIWAENLHAYSVARQPNNWPLLGTLSIPVLVLAGQDDEKYKKFAERIGSEVSSQNIKIEIIPNCGHIIHREQPEWFCQSIIKWVQKLTSMAGT
ncbi:MAG: alpha/beta fold hydrolase [Planctomycetota bacterium]